LPSFARLEGEATRPYVYCGSEELKAKG
jgi:hypothetical protein